MPRSRNGQVLASAGLSHTPAGGSGACVATAVRDGAGNVVDNFFVQSDVSGSDVAGITTAATRTDGGYRLFSIGRYAICLAVMLPATLVTTTE